MAETIQDIPLAELHPFPDHPFGVRDDDTMQQTVESIREYGVLVPAIARPREDGGYELIAGHRRKHACEMAGLQTMPGLSVTSTTMPPSSSWWTAICSGRTSCPARKPRRTR